MTQIQTITDDGEVVAVIESKARNVQASGLEQELSEHGYEQWAEMAGEAQVKIEELEARLKEAQADAAKGAEYTTRRTLEAEAREEGWRKESESHRARATHLENSRDRYEARLKEAEGKLTEACNKVAEGDSLFRVTMKEIHGVAEFALGYEQVCDAQTAVQRLAVRFIAEGNRAEKAEADARRLRSAIEKVEWVEHICPWCQWCDEGHKPDCARQAALSPAEGEESEGRSEHPIN